MIGPDGVIMMVMADDDKRFKLFIHMTYELKLRYELQIRLDSLTHWHWHSMTHRLIDKDS
jgi:hypothetical protein